MMYATDNQTKIGQLKPANVNLHFTDCILLEPSMSQVGTNKAPITRKLMLLGVNQSHICTSDDLSDRLMGWEGMSGTYRGRICHYVFLKHSINTITIS